MRRKTLVALGLLAAGTALTGYAGSSYARGWLAQERARSEWDARMASAAVAHGRALAGGTAPATPAAIGSPVARLVIAKIELDDIVLEGVTDEALNGGPGHLPGSASPGTAGNSVISAHRDRHFRKLGQLSLGDTITTYTMAGPTTWRIVDRKVVNRGAPALHAETSPVLTLTTCWPIGYLGGAPQRLIIRAVPDTRELTAGARAFSASHTP